jgi:hypothetical protein
MAPASIAAEATPAVEIRSRLFIVDVSLFYDRDFLFRQKLSRIPDGAAVARWKNSSLSGPGRTIF